MENRAKYCAVVSCVYNRGTYDPKIHMFKIPKDRDLAVKWLSFLGIDSNISGFICNQHFKDEYMYKEKNRLKPVAAPAAFANNIGKAGKAESTFCQKAAKHNSSSTEVSDMIESFSAVVSLSHTSSALPNAMAINPCEQCMEKDDRIDK